VADSVVQKVKGVGLKFVLGSRSASEACRMLISSEPSTGMESGDIILCLLNVQVLCWLWDYLNVLCLMDFLLKANPGHSDWPNESGKYSCGPEEQAKGFWCSGMFNYEVIHVYI
jgi:hypothetical protein